MQVPLVCFCHHKCASQYVKGVFQTAAHWFGLTFQTVRVVNLSSAEIDEAGRHGTLRVQGSDTEEPAADILYFGIFWQCQC